MKKLFGVLAFVCLSLSGFAQNWTSVTATNITDLNQVKLPAGRMCFLGTDHNDIPISFNVGGGGQVLARPFCVNVSVGVSSVLTVPNPANTQPAGIYYRITVTDSSTGQQVLKYTQVTFTGGTFALDNYAPTNIGSFSVPSGFAVPSLTVNGPFSVTGPVSSLNATGNTITAGKFVGDCSSCTGITGATGGISNTGATTIASDTGASGTAATAISVNNAVRWNFYSTSNNYAFAPNVDNAYDIGLGAGLGGVRNGFFGNGVFSPSFLFRSGSGGSPNGSIQSFGMGNFYFTSADLPVTDPAFWLYRLTGVNQENAGFRFDGTANHTVVFQSGNGGTGVRRNLNIDFPTVSIAGADTFKLPEGNSCTNTGCDFLGSNAFRLYGGATLNGILSTFGMGQAYLVSGDGVTDPGYFIYRLTGVNQEAGGMRFVGGNHAFVFGTTAGGTGVRRNMSLDAPNISIATGDSFNGPGGFLWHGGTQPTYKPWGDSITAGTGASIAANRYTNLLAAAFAWNYPTNYANGGDGTLRQTSHMVFDSPVTQNEISSIMIGQNSVATTSAQEQEQYRAILGAAAWRAVPDVNQFPTGQVVPKQSAQYSGVTTSGTWANAVNGFSAIAKNTTAAAASLTFANIPGRAPVVVLEQDFFSSGTAPTFEIDLDGVAVWTGQVQANASEFNANDSVTWTYGPFGVIVPTPANDRLDSIHTIVVKCTIPGTNGCTVLGVVGDSGAYDNSGPEIYVSGIFTWNNTADQAGVDLTDTADRWAVNALAAGGFNVTYVDTQGFINGQINGTSNLTYSLFDVASGHPNDAGNARMATAFRNIMTSLVKPAERQASTGLAYRNSDRAWNAAVPSFAFATNYGHISRFTPSIPVLISRIQVASMLGFYTPCTTAPIVNVTDGTSTVSVSLAATNDTDSGTLNQQFNAATPLFITITPGVSCTLSGSTPSLNITVQVQPL